MSRIKIENYTAPYKSWGGLRDANVFKVFDHSFHDIEAYFLVGKFPASEHHKGLQFTPFFEKFNRMSQFYLIIVRVNIRGEFDLLHLLGVLRLHLLFLLLSLFIQAFSKIHYPAHRRSGVVRDKDEIEPFVFG